MRLLSVSWVATPQLLRVVSIRLLYPESSCQLWDIPSGKQIRRLGDLPPQNQPPKGNAADRRIVAFSPDGKSLAVTATDGIHLFDPTTGKEVERLPAKLSDTRSVQYTRDGKKLAYGGNDGKAIVWDLPTKRILYTFSGSSSIGGYLAVTPDNKTLALGTSGTYVQLWDLDTGKERWAPILGHRAPIAALEFAPDGMTLVSTARYGHGPILLWNTADWQPSGSLAGATNWLAFSPDGKLATVQCGDGQSGNQIRLWDFAAKKEVSVLNVSSSDSVTGARFSLDGQTLYTLEAKMPGELTAQYWLRHWDLASGKQKKSIPIAKEFLPMSIATDGKTINALFPLGGFCLFDAESGRVRLRFDKHQVFEDTLLSPDGKVLASWSRGGHAQLWDVMTGKEITALKVGTSLACWSADCRLFATARSGTIKSRDHAVSLWDAMSGAEIKQFAELDDEVTALAFSPGGKFLACGQMNGVILVMDTGKSRAVQESKMTAGTLATLWNDLGNEDPARAFPAMAKFVSSPTQTIRFFQERLKPVSIAESAKIQKWIAELESENFPVRLAAAKELEKIGLQLRPVIQKALDTKPPLETRRRLEQILNSFEPEILCRIRAIMALERIGTQEARSILETLARDAPQARETEGVQAALLRLTRRLGSANR